MTAKLPDDTELFVDEGALQFAEVTLSSWHVLPATAHQAPAVLLDSGQVWNEEYELDARLDASLNATLEN